MKGEEEARPCFLLIDGKRTVQLDAKTTRRRVQEFEMAVHSWLQDNPGKKCPDQLAAVRKYLPAQGSTVTGPPRDQWNSELRLTCDDRGAAVVSAGPDRKFDTADDVTSEEIAD